MNIKRTLLNWCFKRVMHNLRSLDARQICEMKYRMRAFNCTNKKWDKPNVRKSKITDFGEI